LKGNGGAHRNSNQTEVLVSQAELPGDVVKRGTDIAHFVVAIGDKVSAAVPVGAAVEQKYVEASVVQDDAKPDKAGPVAGHTVQAHHCWTPPTPVEKPAGEFRAVIRSKLRFTVGNTSRPKIIP